MALHMASEVYTKELYSFEKRLTVSPHFGSVKYHRRCWQISEIAADMFAAQQVHLFRYNIVQRHCGSY